MIGPLLPNCKLFAEVNTLEPSTVTSSTTNCVKVPSIVKPGALVTLAPNAVSVKTVFVLIFIPLLAAKSINSELVQLSVPSCHTNDLSP